MVIYVGSPALSSLSRPVRERRLSQLFAEVGCFISRSVAVLWSKDRKLDVVNHVTVYKVVPKNRSHWGGRKSRCPNDRTVGVYCNVLEDFHEYSLENFNLCIFIKQFLSHLISEFEILFCFATISFLLVLFRWESKVYWVFFTMIAMMFVYHCIDFDSVWTIFEIVFKQMRIF